MGCDWVYWVGGGYDFATPGDADCGFVDCGSSSGLGDGVGDGDVDDGKDEPEAACASRGVDDGGGSHAGVEDDGDEDEDEDIQPIVLDDSQRAQDGPRPDSPRRGSPYYYY